MKKFEKPEMEVIVFEAEDIITTSTTRDIAQNSETEEAIEDNIMESSNSSNYDLKNSIPQGTQNGQEESETIDLTKGSTTEPTTEPATDPTTESTTDPTTESTIESTIESTTDPTVTVTPDGV